MSWFRGTSPLDPEYYPLSNDVENQHLMRDSEHATNARASMDATDTTRTVASTAAPFDVRVITRTVTPPDDGTAVSSEAQRNSRRAPGTAAVSDTGETVNTDGPSDRTSVTGTDAPPPYYHSVMGHNGAVLSQAVTALVVVGMFGFSVYGVFSFFSDLDTASRGDYFTLLNESRTRLAEAESRVQQYKELASSAMQMSEQQGEALASALDFIKNTINTLNLTIPSHNLTVPSLNQSEPSELGVDEAKTATRRALDVISDAYVQSDVRISDGEVTEGPVSEHA